METKGRTWEDCMYGEEVWIQHERELRLGKSSRGYATIHLHLGKIILRNWVLSEFIVTFFLNF